MGELPEAVRRTVRKVSVGGAPTPMSAKRELGRIFAGAEIIEAYGQTESTDGVTMARGTSVFDRPGTIGTANPHVDRRGAACRRRARRGGRGGRDRRRRADGDGAATIATAPPARPPCATAGCTPATAAAATATGTSTSPGA